jgi:hypothetical protein
MVRTWSIQSFSLVTLKGLLMKYLTAAAVAAKAEREGSEGGAGAAQQRRSSAFNTGAAAQLEAAVAAEAETSNPFGSVGGALNFGFGAMAMSPITLLHEWKAHSSPFLSRKCTVFLWCRLLYLVISRTTALIVNAVEYIWFDKKVKSAEESTAEEMDDYMSGLDLGGGGSPGKRSSSIVKFGPGTGTAGSSNRTRSPPKSPSRASRGAVLLDHLDGPLVGSSRAVSAPQAPQPHTPAAMRRADSLSAPVDGARYAASALAPLKQHAARVKREKQSDMGNDILEGYIMSAGLDQRVFLWSLGGKCVGMFGAYGWEIDNEASWFKGATLTPLSKYSVLDSWFTLVSLLILPVGLPSDIKAKETALKAQLSGYTGDYSRTIAESAKASNINKDTTLVRSPSTILIQSIGKHRTHTSTQLNAYVEALCRKIGDKPPVFLDGDAHFSSIMVCATSLYVILHSLTQHFFAPVLSLQTNHPIAKIGRSNKPKK